jgi:hypothetical protein
MLHNLHSSPDIVRVMKLMTGRLIGNVERMGEIRNIEKILVWKLYMKKSWWILEILEKYDVTMD